MSAEVLPSLFYFATTILIFGALFWAHEKLKDLRRPMRITGWLALMILDVLAIWMVGRLALVRLELSAATAWLGVAPPWYYRPAVVLCALFPLITLLLIARICVARAVREFRGDR
jgi:hypothetical protein